MQGKRFLAYTDRLFAFAISLTRDHDQARDVLHECAVKAFAAFRVPRDEAAYRAWLFKILRNAFIDRQRKEGRVTTMADVDEAEAKPADWDIENHLINAISVKQGMELLGPIHREIIGLIDIAGLSYAEAADVLDVPVGTVMSRITRARHALIGHVRGTNVRHLSARKRTSTR